MQKEQLNWNVESFVRKYDRAELEAADLLDATEEEILAAGIEPYEVATREGNMLLNEGIGRLLDLLIGAGGTNYGNTNARLHVGDGTATVAATQAGLQGVNQFAKGMDTGFPTRTNQTVTFKATYTDTEANFAWQEWSIDNGAVAQESLNRKVVSLGTKSGGSWALTCSITVS